MIFFSSCRLWYNSLFFEVQVHFFFLVWLLLFFFYYSNESVCITTGDEPGNVYGGGYEKHTACIYCTFVIWVCFSCFFFFFFLSRESRKAVNFILRHCTVDQSCKYFTSTEKQTICFVVSQQIKKVLLFYLDVSVMHSFIVCVAHFVENEWILDMHLRLLWKWNSATKTH